MLVSQGMLPKLRLETIFQVKFLCLAENIFNLVRQNLKRQSRLKTCEEWEKSPKISVKVLPKCVRWGPFPSWWSHSNNVFALLLSISLTIKDYDSLRNVRHSIFSEHGTVSTSKMSFNTEMFPVHCLQSCCLLTDLGFLNIHPDQIMHNQLTVAVEQYTIPRVNHP